MSTLIVHGNINKYTFANSIAAAALKAIEIFDQKISQVYIINSRDSDRILKLSDDWITHINKFGIGDDMLISRIIDFDKTSESIDKYVSYLERIIKTATSSDTFILDLTNGTTFHKNLLSIAAYLLEISNQYAIDMQILSALTKERGFLDASILSLSYAAAPDSTQFDKLSYLNMTEVIRYRQLIERYTAKYAKVDESNSDASFFKDNLMKSIQLKLFEDLKGNNAVYRIVSSSILTSIEDLIKLILMAANEERGNPNVMGESFGQNIQRIDTEVDRRKSPEFDLKFFRLFNEFMLYIRNSTIHKGRLLTNFEKFKADLAIKLAFPFIELYTDVVYPLLSSGANISKPKQFKRLDMSSEEHYYYGVDGDNTGHILEELFVSVCEEKRFKEISQSIVRAIDQITKYIKSYNKSSIIFAAGDDILFKGRFDRDCILGIQKIYADATGLTCSIGYGRSLQEVYIAMKMAKTQPGKNAVVGIELI